MLNAACRLSAEDPIRYPEEEGPLDAYSRSVAAVVDGVGPAVVRVESVVQGRRILCVRIACGQPASSRSLWGPLGNSVENRLVFKGSSVVKDWLTEVGCDTVRLALGYWQSAQFPEPAHQITSVPCRPR